MAGPNRAPLRIEYTDENGALKWTEPFYDPALLPSMVLALRVAGATELRVFHDAAVRPHPCMSYSKFDGNPINKFGGRRR